LKLAIDEDGRIRADLRPFASKTGRSQPSSTAYIFGLPKYMRDYIRAPRGCCLIQGDYSQQEVLICAILSGDAALLRTYMGGDVYLGLARQLGLVPDHATIETHRHQRNMCKSLLLGLLYQMTAEGLSVRLGLPYYEGKALHERLRKTFKTYFQWSEDIIMTTRVGCSLVTSMGWKLRPRPLADTARTRVNFLVQASGADVLRVACLLAAARGLKLIATVHDSLIIQGDVSTASDELRVLREVMLEAAVIVLGDRGSVMRVDMNLARPGRPLKLDEADRARFREIERWLDEISPL
jgi:DNA polymerase I-like protein with 3'-5' exonuclease and polymerase domains